MTEDLIGKVAIVTGAGRGLGKAIALALSDAGASVVIASRTLPELETVAAEIVADGGNAYAVTVDVTNEVAVDELVEAAIRRFGRIDIVVNNSGVVDTSPLLEQTPAAWDRVLDTNLRGTYLLTRAAGAHLVAQGSGKIINIASNFGLMGVANHAAYSASKAAVIAFTRSMAVEWARAGVQVNAIAPGYFETPLNAGLRADREITSKVLRAIPARRMGTPDELKPWVLLLAGTASDFMTGEIIVIDGGQSVA